MREAQFFSYFQGAVPKVGTALIAAQDWSYMAEPGWLFKEFESIHVL